MVQDEAEDTIALDMLKGALAGAVGVWAMDRVDWFMYDHESADATRQTIEARPGGMDPAHVMASQAARAFGGELSSPRQNPAGLAVHYSLGIMPGALYGAAMDRVPYVDAGRGLLYGLALFILEDEIANPALGTAAGPRQYPWQAHGRGLVAHLVYGFVTDAVFRAMNGGRRGRGGR